jgi:hypothetical protein
VLAVLVLFSVGNTPEVEPANRAGHAIKVLSFLVSLRVRVVDNAAATPPPSAIMPSDA